MVNWAPSESGTVASVRGGSAGSFRYTLSDVDSEDSQLTKSQASSACWVFLLMPAVSPPEKVAHWPSRGPGIGARPKSNFGSVHTVAVFTPLPPANAMPILPLP